jgi:hypothetical protein
VSTGVSENPFDTIMKVEGVGDSGILSDVSIFVPDCMASRPKREQSWGSAI